MITNNDHTIHILGIDKTTSAYVDALAAASSELEGKVDAIASTIAEKLIDLDDFTPGDCDGCDEEVHDAHDRAYSIAIRDLINHLIKTLA